VTKYTIFYAPTTVKDLAAIPRKQAAKIMKKVDRLVQKPWPNTVKKYKGIDAWGMQVDKYRVIFLEDDDNNNLIIAHVVLRRDLLSYTKNIDPDVFVEWLRQRLSEQD